MSWTIYDTGGLGQGFNYTLYYYLDSSDMWHGPFSTIEEALEQAAMRLWMNVQHMVERRDMTDEELEEAIHELDQGWKVGELRTVEPDEADYIMDTQGPEREHQLYFRTCETRGHREVCATAGHRTICVERRIPNTLNGYGATGARSSRTSREQAFRYLGYQYGCEYSQKADRLQEGDDPWDLLNSEEDINYILNSLDDDWDEFDLDQFIAGFEDAEFQYMHAGGCDRTLNGYGAPMRRSHVPGLGTRVRFIPTSSFEAQHFGRDGLMRGMEGMVTQARPPSDDPVCDPEGRMVAVVWDTGAPNPPNLCVPIHALQIVSKPPGYEGYGQNPTNIDDVARLKSEQTVRMPFWEPDDGSDRRNWATFVGHHRDSEPLEESNWQVISEDLQNRFPDDTEVVRFRHWGVGWVEELFVRIRDSRGRITPAFEAGVEWMERLAEYPVADEEHFSQTEYEMGYTD